MSNYKILADSEFDSITYDSVICEKTNVRNMYISGVTLQSNIKNRNNRIYPEKVLDEAVYKYINENVNMTMEGELKHPTENAHEINEDRISHRFIELKKDGNNWVTKAIILDTPTGNQIKNLIEGGVKLGISSRCLGQVKNSNGSNIVQAGLKMVTPGDVVRRPSAPDALINAIYENKEYIFENGVLVEKDLSEDIDKYQKLIAETTKQDRAEVFEKIVMDYFHKIKM